MSQEILRVLELIQEGKVSASPFAFNSGGGEDKWF